MKILVFLLVSIAYLLLPSAVSAHCPLCVGGAAVGLSIARYFGIDDSITGVWIAALLGAVSFWLETYLGKRIKFRYLRPTVYIAFFGLTIWSFYALNDYIISNLKFYLINKHAGSIFGVDKLTFGVLSGGILFYLVDLIDDTLIKRNGKVYFPYQRIVVSLGSMLLLSIGIFILINYFI